MRADDKNPFRRRVESGELTPLPYKCLLIMKIARKFMRRSNKKLPRHLISHGCCEKVVSGEFIDVVDAELEEPCNP
jgi:hypothetical protein